MTHVTSQNEVTPVTADRAARGLRRDRFVVRPLSALVRGNSLGLLPDLLL